MEQAVEERKITMTSASSSSLSGNKRKAEADARLESGWHTKRGNRRPCWSRDRLRFAAPPLRDLSEAVLGATHKTASVEDRVCAIVERAEALMETCTEHEAAVFRDAEQLSVMWRFVRKGLFTTIVNANSMAGIVAAVCGWTSFVPGRAATMGENGAFVLSEDAPSGATELGDLLVSLAGLSLGSREAFFAPDVETILRRLEAVAAWLTTMVRRAPAPAKQAAPFGDSGEWLGAVLDDEPQKEDLSKKKIGISRKELSLLSMGWLKFGGGAKAKAKSGGDGGGGGGGGGGSDASHDTVEECDTDDEEEDEVLDVVELEDEEKPPEEKKAARAPPIPRTPEQIAEASVSVDALARRGGVDTHRWSLALSGELFLDWRDSLRHKGPARAVAGMDVAEAIDSLSRLLVSISQAIQRARAKGVFIPPLGRASASKAAMMCANMYPFKDHAFSYTGQNAALLAMLWPACDEPMGSPEDDARAYGCENEDRADEVLDFHLRLMITRAMHEAGATDDQVGRVMALIEPEHLVRHCGFIAIPGSQAEGGTPWAGVSPDGDLPGIPAAVVSAANEVFPGFGDLPVHKTLFQCCSEYKCRRKKYPLYFEECLDSAPVKPWQKKKSEAQKAFMCPSQYYPQIVKVPKVVEQAARRGYMDDEAVGVPASERRRRGMWFVVRQPHRASVQFYERDPVFEEWMMGCLEQFWKTKFSPHVALAACGGLYIGDVRQRRIHRDQNGVPRDPADRTRTMCVEALRRHNRLNLEVGGSRTGRVIPPAERVRA